MQHKGKRNSFSSSCTAGPPQYIMKGGNDPLAHITLDATVAHQTMKREPTLMDVHMVPVQTVVGLKVGKYCISHA